MNFLSNLSNLMEINNINKKELANVLGISPSTITMWYSRGCDNVSITTLIKLSKYFGVSMEELVNGKPNKLKTLIFTEKDYTKNELNAIIDFSKFLKSNRSVYEYEIAEELTNINKSKKEW